VASRLALGGAHSVAMRSNGTVACWGLNSSAQCTPPANVGSLIAIAAGTSHTVGLRSNRTVVAWGSNAFGESTVPNGVSDVRAIAAGPGQHTLALMGDGSVFGWGRNDFGQTSAVTGTEDSRLIAAGGNFSIAVTRSSADCDNNSVIDTCELLSGAAADCNGNGLIDACDISGGSVADCDGDGIPNSCEIASGQSSDLDGNSIPDNCELVVGGSGYASIQAAVNAAASGATVLVGPGTYTGSPINFGDKRIRLRSIAGPNATILDGTGLSVPILTIASSLANDSEIVGFTFRNAQRNGAGTPTQGGAMSVTGTMPFGFLRLTISSCIFENNSAGSGGAIYAFQLVGRIEGCDFRNNSAGSGGAIFAGRGIWEIRNCSINTSTANQGGGIYADSPFSGLVFATALQQNTAASGSALLWRQLADAGPMSMTASTVELNTGPDTLASAAITIEGVTPLNITGSYICLNTPRNFAGTVVIDSSSTVSGDCDGNGICDAEDIANGVLDSNGNGIPDGCEARLGDINGDGNVNGQDLTLLLSQWGTTNPAADLNHDGIVSSADITVLLTNWGSNP
jgi:predicted outer membrane repeat protein